jgi:hypothetical protein
MLLVANSFMFSQCVTGDCENGYGEAKLKGGDSYTGYWKNGQFNGKGLYKFKDGSYWDGEFNNGFFDGYGTHFDSSDSTFTICYWEKGRINDGKVVIKKGNQIYYDGEMKDGRYNGPGILNDEDGDKYEGNFKDGLPDGIGKYEYADGSNYEGNFKEGRPDGLGKYEYADGGKYEGNFKNGDWDGIGKLYTASGDMYDGQFRNGKFEGYGKYFYADGNRYEGEFKNMLFNGKGILYYKDGTRFDGNFVNDIKEGFGTMYFANGGKQEGNYKNGEFVPVAEFNKSLSNNQASLTGNATSNIIKLVKTESNLYEIPIKINNVLNINFLMDTGASELFLTADVILTLIRTRTITEDDILEGGYYTDAQGNVNYNVRFNIKEIEIGGYKIPNVAAGVADKLEANNLLGQNVLIQLKKFTIDYENETFTIVD